MICIQVDVIVAIYINKANMNGHADSPKFRDGIQYLLFREIR